MFKQYCTFISLANILISGGLMVLAKVRETSMRGRSLCLQTLKCNSTTSLAIKLSYNSEEIRVKK